MTLYEIEQEILALQDPETGELPETEEFKLLQQQWVDKAERLNKAEHIVLWYKDILADAKKIKDEIDRLTERKDFMERKAERLKGYIGILLEGEKLHSAMVDVRYRKSKSVEVYDDSLLAEFEDTTGYDVFRYARREPCKATIKDLIEKGVEVPGAHIVEKVGMVIK